MAKCDVCEQEKHCISIDVEWTLLDSVCEECWEKECDEHYGHNVNTKEGNKINYKEVWDEQKDFMRATIHWMEAVSKTADSEKEKSDALSQKKLLEIMVKRMEDKEDELLKNGEIK